VKLLIDEMYSPAVAERLRDRGHDAVSAQESPELRSAPDVDVFRLMQLERRVIVTNNHRHFVPLANAALRNGETFHGVVFTADRSLSRNKRTIPVMVDLLDELLNRHRGDEKLAAGIEWLAPRSPDEGR
jgi:predicted nuclease of predicted toxin-antitoxin system